MEVKQVNAKNGSLEEFVREKKYENTNLYAVNACLRMPTGC